MNECRSLECLEPAANVLLEGTRADGDRACADLLRGDGDGRLRVVAVVVGEDPDDWLDRVRSSMGTEPERIGVISVGEPARSAAVATGVLPGSVEFATIPSATDLGELGVRITDYLESFASCGECRTGVCVSSVSDLLEHGDRERVFRFLHILLGHVRSVGAVGHYHLDPDAHDPGTVAVIEELFDETVAPDGRYRD